MLQWLIWLLVLLGFWLYASSAVISEEVEVATVTVSEPIGQPTPTPASIGSSWQPVVVNGIEGVIVSEQDASMFVDGLGVEEDGYWMPSETDVAAFERALADEEGDIAGYRQYAGFIENGERKIVVVGFCRDPGVDWRTEPVLVLDGGPCFCDVTYNVDTGEIERFYEHGEA